MSPGQPGTAGARRVWALLLICIGFVLVYDVQIPFYNHGSSQVVEATASPSIDFTRDRVAFVLRGGVSLVGSKFMGRPGGSNYVNWTACAVSIKKHIFQANPDLVFDVFIQGWDPALEKPMTDVYQPVATRFEDPLNWRDEIMYRIPDSHPAQYLPVNVVSQALAFRLALELVEGYVKEKHRTPSTTPFRYKFVILYRPDMLLWTDMNLNTYDPHAVTVNAHEGGGGDFHFVMGFDLAMRFKDIFDMCSPDPGHFQCATGHTFTKRFVTSPELMNSTHLLDNIVPGHSQEVIRKVHKNSFLNGYISEAQLATYGLSLDEVSRYAGV
jgi:hypothetical protein